MKKVARSRECRDEVKHIRKCDQLFVEKMSYPMT